MLYTRHCGRWTVGVVGDHVRAEERFSRRVEVGTLADPPDVPDEVLSAVYALVESQSRACFGGDAPGNR